MVENEYDAIVLDVNLPGMDGFEVLGRLRAKGRRTPVLMFTARGGLQERLRGAFEFGILSAILPRSKSYDARTKKLSADQAGELLKLADMKVVELETGHR